VGVGRIAFSNTNSGTFSYTVDGISQSRPLVRFVFASPVPACAFSSTVSAAQVGNYTDTWVVPNLAEPGWGINFTHQGDVLFASWFMYDANGAPFWGFRRAGEDRRRRLHGHARCNHRAAVRSVPFDSSHLTHSTVGPPR